MIRITEIKERPKFSAPCEELLLIEDKALGLRSYLAIHLRRHGLAFGGIRRRAFASDEEAQSEVLGLARGMGRKLAFAGLEADGAKAVLMAPEGIDTAPLYRALGRAMNRIGPRWVAGPDVGTGEDELDELRRETDMVNAGQNDPGAATALGVLMGLRAAHAFRFGDDCLVERRILIQGLGSVGRSLAESLLAEKARLSVSELRVRETEALMRTWLYRGYMVEFQAPLDPQSYVGDIAVPCALGGFVNEGTAFGLDVQIICGSANEVLAKDELDDVLHRRGVLYVPDFSVNAGAVIEGVVIHQEGEAGRDRAQRLIAATGDRLRDLLDEAAAAGTSPFRLATRKLEDHFHG